MRGEWSQSPYHSGRAAFAWARSRTGGLWGLKEVGFPSRIAAIALEVAKEAPEEVLGELLLAVREDGGPYIDMVHCFQDRTLDRQLLMSFYWPRRRSPSRP